MPFVIKHNPHSHLVSLVNKNTGHVYSKATTQSKAHKQMSAIEINKKKKESEILTNRKKRGIK